MADVSQYLQSRTVCNILESARILRTFTGRDRVAGVPSDVAKDVCLSLGASQRAPFLGHHSMSSSLLQEEDLL